MFTEMRVRSFKSWEDSGSITLAPVTGFFGDPIGEAIAMAEVGRRRASLR